jgi:hypothetical protein
MVILTKVISAMASLMGKAFTGGLITKAMKESGIKDLSTAMEYGKELVETLI